MSGSFAMDCQSLKVGGGLVGSLPAAANAAGAAMLSNSSARKERVFIAQRLPEADREWPDYLNRTLKQRWMRAWRSKSFGMVAALRSSMARSASAAESSLKR